MFVFIPNLSLGLCLSLIVGVLWIYLYLARNFYYWKKRGVKQLNPTFFFGNIIPCFLAKETPQEFLRKLYQFGKGEKMIGFYVFNKPHLMLRDPELIKHVFIKDFSNFANKILSGNDNDPLSENVFLVQNPPWKSIRIKLTPVFSSGKIKKMFNLMLEIMEDFDRYIENLDIDEQIGKPIEIKEINAKLMTDIIGTTAYGTKFNSLNDPEAEFRKFGKRIFRSGYKRYLEMLSIFFIPSLRRFTNPQFFDDKTTQFLRNAFWHVINDRIKSNVKRSDLIDLLIDIKKNQEKEDTDNYKLEGDALVAQAAIFFTGGFETSSTTMSFAMYEIAKNQEIQTTMRNEISNGLEKTNGKITYELVTKLPYLDMVVHETLRMYPVIPFLDRVSETDYTFPGTNITIEKGTPVMLPMRSLHMDPNYFHDPEKFIPERFSEENRKNIIPCTFFPFGEGPRNCIGMRLGLIQVKLGLMYFLAKYEITPCKETPTPIKIDGLNVFLHSKGELHLGLKKLSSQLL